ncbi:Uncharacterized protein HZ326_12292 [Fusarium oxysporum f. sp. albedinis]|nr:Uncharacterized protein HZ326_12292 [Fusarium oxysporum f. sp. albedinis]
MLGFGCFGALFSHLETLVRYLIPRESVSASHAICMLIRSAYLRVFDHGRNLQDSPSIHKNMDKMLRRQSVSTSSSCLMFQVQGGILGQMLEGIGSF